ncbi:MAG: histidinol dehydrogenase, partial [Tannerellaceae bacterium]
MKRYTSPVKADWSEIIKRPLQDTTTLFDLVQNILIDIKLKGDSAVQEYSQKFDGVAPANVLVTDDEIREANLLVTDQLKDAIYAAKANIEKFHAAQRFEEIKVQTSPGVICWQKAVAIEKVGLYIPGGSAPLFSTVLMLAVPAMLAGCNEIVLCTPPDKKGKIHPAILFAATVAGVDKIYKIGGVQAIGAMAYGTATVPKVYKIFGPGNQYVTAAKQLVSLHGTAIDMPAGPSEVLVIADETANPQFVAADLLSQAEHGADSQSVLVATSQQVLDNVAKAIEEQLGVLPRMEIAKKALKG